MTDVSKFIVIIRPEFMTFCHDACRAATLNHLLFRIAGKCKDQVKEKIQAGKILWYLKNEDITAEMSHAWGVCKVGKEVNELVKMNLLGRCSNPSWGVDRTKHFFFGAEQCATFLKYYEEQNLCFVHADLSDEVKHLIYSSNANDISIKCKCVIHQMHSIHLSDANDISIEAITKIDYKENTKNTNEEIPSVPEAQSSEPSFVTLPRDGGNDIQSLREGREEEISHSQWLSETAIQAESHAPGGGTSTGLPNPVQTPAPSLKGIQPLQPTRNDATGQATQQSTGTTTTVITPPPTTETDGNGKYKKPQGKQFKQPFPHSADEPRQFTHDMTLTPEEVKRRGRWQHHFNALRGGELLDKIGPRHEERYCIGYLVAKYTDEQITALNTFYQTEEPYWKRPENRVRFSGIILWEKQQEGATYLKLMNRWPLSPGEAPAAPPRAIKSSYTPWVPHEEIIPRAAQVVAR